MKKRIALTDMAIVQMYLQRDEAAIEETKYKYGKYCYSIAYGILGDIEDAKESENDAYLGIWKSIPPNKPSNLKLYLGKIARNLSLKKSRDNNAAKRGGGQVAMTLEELSECVSGSASPENEVELKELTKILDSFLRKIPENERNVFICRYWYMDSISDISKRYGYGASKIKMMLSRTRKKLKDRLVEEGVIL